MRDHLLAITVVSNRERVSEHVRIRSHGYWAENLSLTRERSYPGRSTNIMGTITTPVRFLHLERGNMGHHFQYVRNSLEYVFSSSLPMLALFNLTLVTGLYAMYYCARPEIPRILREYGVMGSCAKRRHSSRVGNAHSPRNTGHCFKVTKHTQYIIF